MASAKMISLAVALVAVLLFATPQTQAWAAAGAGGDEATDMVPVSPADPRVLVSIPGAGAGTEGSDVCLDCRCCDKSDPSKCVMTKCCTVFKCDHGGKCSPVPLHCGCNNCSN